MGHESTHFDVVVIGGGFAGVTAARDLTEQGKTVLLLEAQDRLGGRTWSKTYPGTDIPIEMGGQFVLAREVWPELHRELDRYGVGTHHAPGVESYPTILNGQRHAGPFPIPVEQMFELERAVLHAVKAASRIETGTPFDQQDLADLDISVADFFGPLGLPAETYDFITTVFGLYAFRFPEEGSVLQGLNVLACLDLSALQMWGALDAFIHTFDLVGQLAAEVTEVRMGSPVARVDQTGEEVVVKTVSDETFTARAVVVASPLNTWNDIEFDPPLSDVKRDTSAERHGTERSAKAWVRARNAVPHPFLIAAPRSAGGGLALFTEHDFENGDQLMCMFAYASMDGDDYHLDFDDPDSVAATLDRLSPGARMIDFHSHNYVTDPFAKGDWISWRPGRLTRSHSALGAPEGRIAFAGADIAPKWFMMIEGAVESGHKAALETIGHLSGQAEIAGVKVP